MPKNFQIIKFQKKKFLIFFLILIIGSIIIYFHFQRQSQIKEAKQVKKLLIEINEDIYLMDAIKDKMPKELLKVHEYLMSGGVGKKLYRADPRVKDAIMYHGAKTQSIYINPDVKIKKELWIPTLYHEVAHNYWHSKHPAKTFEEFQKQLFDSENFAYTVNAQAWDLVMKYYPVKKEELKTELERRLFKIYTQETEIYNKMIKGNPQAKELWNKIIEADIKEQQKYQKLLFEK